MAIQTPYHYRGFIKENEPTFSCAGSIILGASGGSLFGLAIQQQANHNPIPVVGLMGLMSLAGSIPLVYNAIRSYCTKPVIRDEKTADLIYRQFNKTFPNKTTLPSKIYYDVRYRTFNLQRHSITPRYRVSLKRLMDGSYVLKTLKFLSLGMKKDVYLEWQFTNEERKPIVRAVEYKGGEMEAKILNAFNHSPFFCHVLAITDKKRIFFGTRTYYLKFCDLGSVDELKFSLKEELHQLFYDYFRGLQELHDAGFIHGDLHSGNLFVETRNTIKRGCLGDFGKAQESAKNEDRLSDIKRLTEQYRDEIEEIGRDSTDKKLFKSLSKCESAEEAALLFKSYYPNLI